MLETSQIEVQSDITVCQEVSLQLLLTLLVFTFRKTLARSLVCLNPDGSAWGLDEPCTFSARPQSEQCPVSTHARVARTHTHNISTSWSTSGNTHQIAGHNVTPWQCPPYAAYHYHRQVIYDLLDPNNRKRKGAGLEIREHGVLGIYVKGLQVR